MGRMKDHLLHCQELLEQGNYRELLLELKPWGEDAPRELWAVLALHAATWSDGSDYIHYGKDQD